MAETETALVRRLFCSVAVPDHKPKCISWLQRFCMHETLIFSLPKVLFASHLSMSPFPSAELSDLSLPGWSDEQSDHQKQHHT